MIFCINYKRKVLVDRDPNSLCSCIVTCFPILSDKGERLRIKESRTYFVSTITRSASHPRLNYNSFTNNMKFLQCNAN
jgi:hypothetical protein